MSEVKLFSYNTDTSGCYWYRLFLPFSKIREVSGDTFSYSFKISDIEEVKDYDIVVLQRATDALGIEIMEKAKEHGIPIVYEIDDSLFNIVESNPAYKYYGRQDVRYCIQYLMGQCDAMTVSTKPLAEYYSEYFNRNGELVIAPNSLDPGQPRDPKRIPKNKGMFRLLITGSISHAGDWKIIEPVLHSIMRECPNVEAFIFGYFPEYFKTIPRIAVVQSVKVADYFKALSTIDYDMMLVPLEDIEFNTYKSNLKFVESGALGLPVIASDVYPYTNSIYNGMNGWLVKNSTYHWTKQVKQLCKSMDVVTKVGNAARQTVYNNFNINKNCKIWIDLYNRLLAKNGKEIEIKRWDIING